MYRPNRVGPWPLVNLNDEATSISGFTDGPMNVPAIRFHCPSASTPDEFHSESVVFNPNATLLAESAVAWGVKIVGTPRFTGREYLVSYSGGVAFGTESDGVIARPIIGRTEGSGLSQGDMLMYAFPPPVDLLHHRTGGAEIAAVSCHMNGTVVMGDFKGDGVSTLEADDLFAGFYLQNFGPSSATLRDMRLTTAIHRYETDLTPFDPNR